MGTFPQTLPSGIRNKLSDARTRRPAGMPAGTPSVHLDALRGFAAFSVLLNHWRDAFFVDYSALPHHNPFTAAAYLATGLGHQWVIVFFVMSGNFVGGSVLRSIEAGKWSWRSYLMARMTRLYIVLIPALFLGGIIDWTGMHMAGTAAIYTGHSGMHALIVNVYSTLSWPMLIGNVLLLQTAALPATLGHSISPLGTNGPLWSLCNEFWYYIAFPVAVLLFTKGKSLLTRIVCLLSLVAWGWLVGSEIALLGIPWLMGVLIGSLPPLPARRKTTRVLITGSTLILLTAGLTLDKRLGSLTGDLILGAIVTLLIWVTLHCARTPVPNWYIRAARRAARSSYTLYLVHLPLLIFLKAFLHLPRTLPGWHALMASVGIMILVLLYAQSVYQLFERNTDALRQWLKPFVLGRETT